MRLPTRVFWDMACGWVDPDMITKCISFCFLFYNWHFVSLRQGPRQRNLTQWCSNDTTEKTCVIKPELTHQTANWWSGWSWSPGACTSCVGATQSNLFSHVMLPHLFTGVILHCIHDCLQKLLSQKNYLVLKIQSYKNKKWISWNEFQTDIFNAVPLTLE